MAQGDVVERKAGRAALDLVRELIRHDGVGTVRRGRARHNADAFALAHGGARQLPGLHLPDDFQRDRRRLRRALRVHRPDGVAVHRGVGQRRNVERRMDVLRERQAVGVEKRNAGGRQALDEAQHALEGSLDAEHIRRSRMRVLMGAAVLAVGAAPMLMPVPVAMPVSVPAIALVSVPVAVLFALAH